MKSKKSKKEKKVKKRKKSKSLTSSVVGSDDDMNLARKLYPLDHHIGDKAELVEQIFAIIQGGQLSAMLPPALKDLPVSELKSLCLVELVKLSTAQVKAVLSGEACPPDSDASGDSDAEKKNQPDSTSASEPLLSGLSTAPSFQGSQPGSKRGSQPSSQSNSQQEGQAAGTKLLTPVDEGKGGEDLTLMELLELEMRARAIKALLERDEGAPTPEQRSSPPPPPPPPGSPPARVKAAWKPVATPATDVVPPPPPTPPPPLPSEPPPTAPTPDVSLPPPPPAPIIRPRSKSGSASPKPVRPSKPRAYRKRRQSSSRSSGSGSSVSRSRSRGRRRSPRSSRSSSSRSRASGTPSPAARKKSRRASSSLSRHSSPTASKPGTAAKRSAARRTSRRASGSSSLSSVSSRSLSRSGSRRRRRRRRRSSSYSRSSLSSGSSRSRSSRRRSRSGAKDRQSPARKPDPPPPTKRKPRPEELEEGEVNSEFESASDAEKEAEERRWKEYNEEATVELGDGEEKRRVPTPEVSQEAVGHSVEGEVSEVKKSSGQNNAEPEVKSNSAVERSVEVCPDEVAEQEYVTLSFKVEHGVVTAGEKGDTDNQHGPATEAAEAVGKETEAEGAVEANHMTRDCVSGIPGEAERVECVEETSITENVVKPEPGPVESAAPPEAGTEPQRAASVVDDSDASGSRDSFHGFELESVVRSSRPPAGVTESLLEAEFSLPGRVDKDAPELASAGLARAEVTPEAPAASGTSDAESVRVGQESEAVKSRRSGRLRGAAAAETAETTSPVVGGRQRRGRGKQRSRPDNAETASSEQASGSPSKTKDNSPEKASESPVVGTVPTPPASRVTRSSPRKAVATQSAAADAPAPRRSRTRSQGAAKLTDVVPTADGSQAPLAEEPAPAEPPAGRGRRRSRRQSPAAAFGRRSRTKSPAAATDSNRRSPVCQSAGPEVVAPSAPVQSEVATPETPRRAGEPDAELSAECGDGSEPETPQKAASAVVSTPPVVKKTDAPPKPTSPAAELTTQDASCVDESPTDEVELPVEVKPTVEVAEADGTAEVETPAEETRTVRVTKSPIRAPPEDVSSPAAQKGKAGGAGSPLAPESPPSSLRSIVTKPASQVKGSSKLSSVVVVAPAVVMKEIGKGGGDGVELEKRLMTLAHGDQSQAEPTTDETKEETDAERQASPAAPPTTVSAAAAGSAGSAPAPDLSPETEAQLRSRGLGYWRELAAEAQHRYLAEEAETERLTRQEEGRLQELEARLQEGQEADDAGMAGHTWAVRWLQSDKVQKVVNNSKLYNKVKQKLKVLKQKAVKPKESEAEPKPEPKVQELPHVIGSIEEYERLFGKKVVVTESQTPATQTETVQTQSSSVAPPVDADVPQLSPPAATVGDDDDDDDDELWGDIMGE